MTDIMAIGISAMNNRISDSELEAQEDVHEAAKSLDKVFVSLLLERTLSNSAQQEEDPALQSFVNNMHVNVISQRMVDGGGVLTDTIENQLSMQQHQSAYVAPKSKG